MISARLDDGDTAVDHSTAGTGHSTAGAGGSAVKLATAGTIDVAEVNRAVRDTPWGGRVVHLAETPSTNDLALAAAQNGAKAGGWVADAQTAGRGRGGHSWHSAPGDGLYVSVLCTPQLPASAADLSLAAGLAAWEAILAVSGLRVDIRWPNDLMTRPGSERGGSRKLGGILVETAAAPAGKSEAAGQSAEGRSSEPGGTAQSAMLRYVVIGIGINVGHQGFPAELGGMASSLRLEGWQLPDRQRLLIALLQQLHTHVGELEERYAEGPSISDTAPGTAPGSASKTASKIGAGMRTRLEQASTWLRGKRVRVPEEGGYTGTTAGLDPSGFLLVEGDDGVRHRVHAGGVREL